MKKPTVPKVSCSVCGLPVIEPTGSLGAVVGFVGEAPDKWALSKRRPISGQNEAALAGELSQVGFSLEDVRITNLWGHAARNKPTGKANSDGVMAWQKDYEANYMAALKAIVKCKIVFLCGAGAIKAFLSDESEKYTGLATTSAKLRGKIVIPAPTLTALAFKPIGELRFCMQTLVKEIKKL